MTRASAILAALALLAAPSFGAPAPSPAPPATSPPAARAVAAKPPAGAPQLPINVTAEALVVEQGGMVIRFEGKVVLVREELTLTCDRLLLRAAEGDPSQIRTGEAEGNVVLVRAGDHATAQKAAFDMEAGRVVLTGSPQLTRGTDTIRGAELTYTTSDGKAAFRGPVEATFTPSQAAFSASAAPARGASAGR
jgi:lipopolysaccharide export system protein LptA